MYSKGHSSNEDGFDDLLDFVEKYNRRSVEHDTDRTQKFFNVPRVEIEGEEGYDLSLSIV